jgi:hypothetical protein
MPKAYWVVTYRSITNPDAWKAMQKARAAGDRTVGGRVLRSAIRRRPAPQASTAHRADRVR